MFPAKVPGTAVRTLKFARGMDIGQPLNITSCDQCPAYRAKRREDWPADRGLTAAVTAAVR